MKKLTILTGILFVLSMTSALAVVECYADDDCANGQYCMDNICENFVEICDDGIDNDYDNYIDTDDLDCQSTDEVPEFGAIGASIALLGAGYIASRKRR